MLLSDQYNFWSDHEIVPLNLSNKYKSDAYLGYDKLTLQLEHNSYHLGRPIFPKIL